MNQDALRKWTEALRGGSYKPAYGQMRWHNKMDALGVLCDLSEQGRWEKLGDIWVYECAEDDWSPYALPDGVAKWAGLDNDPTITAFGHLLTLTELADRVQISHPAVARILELNFAAYENVVELSATDQRADDGYDRWKSDQDR